MCVCVCVCVHVRLRSLPNKDLLVKVSNLRRPSQTASTSVSPNTCTAGHGLVLHGKLATLEDDEDQCLVVQSKTKNGGA